MVPSVVEVPLTAAVPLVDEPESIVPASAVEFAGTVAFPAFPASLLVPLIAGTELIGVVSFPGVTGTTGVVTLAVVFVLSVPLVVLVLLVALVALVWFDGTTMGGAAAEGLRPV